MKKISLIILAIVTVGFAGCKKDSGDKPSGPTADSYFPVTSGSNWTYKDVASSTTSTLTVTMTGKTATFNGKTYYTSNSVSTKNGTSVGYFYAANHAYAIRSANLGAGLTIELQLGNDNQAVGYTWTTTPTDNGQVNGVGAKTINTIKEKDITKTVNGKTFNNVIHTQIDLQYDVDGFQSFAIYDVYLAKGVGMIQLDTHIYDTLVDSETITDYTLK